MICAALLWLSALAQSSPTKHEMETLAATGKLRAAFYLRRCPHRWVSHCAT